MQSFPSKTNTVEFVPFFDSNNYSIEQSNTDNISEEDFNENKSALFSEISDFQSMAINFFSQAISLVTPDIYERILSLSSSKDEDVLESILDFLIHAFKREDLIFDVFTPKIVEMIISVLQNSPANATSLKNLALDAIVLLSQRSTELVHQLLAAGCMQQFSGAIIELLNSPIQNSFYPISKYLSFINVSVKQMTDVEFGELSEILFALYRELIKFSVHSRSIALLSLQSFHYFVTEAPEEILANSPLTELFQLLNSISLNDQISLNSEIELPPEEIIDFDNDMLLIILKLLFSFSYNSFQLSAPFMPIFNKILKIYSNMTKPSDDITIIILQILRNFAGDNDPTIFSFLLTKDIFNLLLSTISNRSYKISRQSCFIYSYLSLALIDQFMTLFAPNYAQIINAMIQLFDMSDPEVVNNILKCFSNVLFWLKTNDAGAFKGVINFLLTQGFDSVLEEVLGSNFDEDIINTAQTVFDVLSEE